MADEAIALSVQDHPIPPTDQWTDGVLTQRLKNILCKFLSDTGRDWNKWIPFLLFAYKEVLQASSGFSPFELLYEGRVQGPLDLLRKSWKAPSSEEKTKDEKAHPAYIDLLHLKDEDPLFHMFHH